MEKEELFIPKTKYKALKIILAIILIGGLMAGGYFLYQYKFNNPKNIVNNIITKAKSNIKESLNNVDDHSKYNISGLFKFDTNINDEELKILKDIELQFNGEIDTKESIGNLDIGSKYQNEKLIDIKAYYEKDLVYLLLEDIYDKYLKINVKEDEVTESIPKINLTKEEVETVFDALLNSFEKEVSKLDIKKVDTTITIDKETIDVINNYIELKDKEVNDFIIGIVSHLDSNQKFMNIMNKLTDNKAKEAFDGLKEGLKEEAFKGIYKICFYTDKGLLNKKLISIRQTMALDDLTLSFNVDKISDDEVLISMIADKLNYSVRIKKNSSVIVLKLNINLDGEYIDIELNMNYEKINSISKPDLTNSKDINELTEEENKQINDKVLENDVLVKLMKKINSIGQKEV